MPLSAPDVSTDPVNFTEVSLRFIDSTGDNRAISGRFGGVPTTAQVQAWAEAEGAASNANLYEVRISSVWTGNEQKSLATEAVYTSVYDNVVLLFAGDLGNSARTFIPAPLEAIMDGDDQPQPTNALLVAVRDAYNTLADIGAESFVPKSVRFTERRDKNEAVKY